MPQACTAHAFIAFFALDICDRFSIQPYLSVSTYHALFHPFILIRSHTYTHTHIHKQANTHTHKYTHIYIYIYIYSSNSTEQLLCCLIGSAIIATILLVLVRWEFQRYDNQKPKPNAHVIDTHVIHDSVGRAVVTRYS